MHHDAAIKWAGLIRKTLIKAPRTLPPECSTLKTSIYGLEHAALN